MCGVLSKPLEGALICKLLSDDIKVSSEVGDQWVNNKKTRWVPVTEFFFYFKALNSPLLRACGRVVGRQDLKMRTTALHKVGWQGTTWTVQTEKKPRRMCIAYTDTVCGEMCNLHCMKRRFSAPVAAKAQSAVVWLLSRHTLCSATPRLVSHTEDTHIWPLTRSHIGDCQCKMFTLKLL